MTVVLKDIDEKKRAKNDYSKPRQEMNTLSEYIDISKKCISMFAGPKTAPEMLADEDAISHVSEHLMWGAVRWKEDGGRSFKSYLNQCAIWAIKTWKTKVYHSNKNKIYSLNHPLGNDTDKECQQYEIIKDEKCEDPFDIVFNNKRKEVERIISKSCLTETQKTCLSERYIEGKKLREIAEGLGVSRQAVNQNISAAIKKIRKSSSDDVC